VSPDDPTLTRRALNRALLARQSLLGRATSPRPRMLERMGGPQASARRAVAEEADRLAAFRL